MLIFNISINKNRTIDEIHVQRVKGGPGDLCTYKIRKPKGFDETDIFHEYDDGYFPLMVAALGVLDDEGYEPKK